MSKYHKKAAGSQDEELLFQQDPTYKAPKFMSLAAQYGLPDNDMDIGGLGHKERTVNQEYQAYMTVPLLQSWALLLFSAIFTHLFCALSHSFPTHSLTRRSDHHQIT